VRQWLGRPEGLLPVVWQALKRGKVVMSVNQKDGSVSYLNIEHGTVKALHVGLIYWGISQMNQKYTNTTTAQGDLMPSAYVDYASAPATNDQYFDKYLRLPPTTASPHPEQTVLKTVLQKLKTTKGAVQGFKDVEIAILRLPPATYWQSWYPVVRIELKPDCRIRQVDEEVTPVVCMVQALDDDDRMTAWSLRLAKVELSDQVRMYMKELLKERKMSGDIFQATGSMGDNEGAKARRA